MEKRTYISQEELDKFLDFLKSKEIWNYYLIVYNLAYSNKTYKELNKVDISEILVPNGIPKPTINPFSINICGVNHQLKIYQTFCGIRDVVRFSTRLFRSKFIMDGKVYYGSIKKKRTSLREFDEYYIYLLKHCHRNPEISKLLTDKKIGITNNVEKRIKLLTLGPVEIEVVKLWKTTHSKAVLTEKKIHSKLSDRRLVGEWFSDEENNLINILDLEMS
jgi:hypothetical protein